MASMMPSLLVTDWHSENKIAWCAAQKHICHSK